MHLTTDPLSQPPPECITSASSSSGSQEPTSAKPSQQPSSPVRVRTNFHGRGYKPPPTNRYNNHLNSSPPIQPVSDTESESPSDQKSDNEANRSPVHRIPQPQLQQQQQQYRSPAPPPMVVPVSSSPAHRTDQFPTAPYQAVRTQSLPFDESLGEDMEPPSLARTSVPSQPLPTEINYRYTAPRPLPESPERRYFSDPDFGKRYMVPAPRIFDPIPYSPLWCGNLNHTNSGTRQMYARDTSPRHYYPAAVSPAFQHDLSYEEFNIQKRSDLAPAGANAALVGSLHANDKEEEDSIFDFDDYEKRRRKVKSKTRDRRERRSTHDDTEDDTSIEASSPVNNLAERSQAAWKRKQARSAKSSSSSSPVPPDFSRSAFAAAKGRTTSPIQQRPVESTNLSSPQYVRSAASKMTMSLSDSDYHRMAGSANAPHVPAHPAVSFGKNDTVHHFEPDPDPDEPDPDDTFDNGTFAGRSLNSEYTKSAESEVEDLIKDIFMIGSGKGNQPGRRKVKYNPQVREKLRQQGQLHNSTDDDEEETLETVEDDDYVPQKSSSEARRSSSMKRKTRTTTTDSTTASYSAEDVKEEDPFVTLFTLVEGGFAAMSTALGLENQPRATCGAAMRSLPPPPKCQPSSARVQGFLSYASDLLGSNSSCDNDVTTEKDVADVHAIASPSLEEDIRLVDLAVQAARSMHKLKGFEFDESCDINIVSDIKFSVVDLTMPFGLIFQENEVGCWITKVLPGGNAEKCATIQVGDQLAAIDGVSAINLKVHEMAQIVKSKGVTLAESTVELTFLRYIGPLRPAMGSLAEEGYEVNAAEKTLQRVNNPSSSPQASPSRSQKQPKSPLKSPRRANNRRDEDDDKRPKSLSCRNDRRSVDTEQLHPNAGRRKLSRSASESSLVVSKSRNLRIQQGPPASPAPKERRLFRLFGRKKQ